jgi:hypothetical protein
MIGSGTPAGAFPSRAGTARLAAQKKFERRLFLSLLSLAKLKV